MTTRCIHDDNIESFLLELGNSLRCNYDRVCFGIGAEICYFSLGCGLSGLVEGSCAKRIGTDDGRFKTTFLIMNCQFCARSRFAVTLRRVILEPEILRTVVIAHTCRPTAIITLDCPFFGLYGSTPGSTRCTSSSNTAYRWA